MHDLKRDIRFCHDGLLFNKSWSWLYGFSFFFFFFSFMLCIECVTSDCPASNKQKLPE